ncbi:MAG TPA: hypothetical protein PLO51_03845 [Candidatus Micrarchaeota archaeon]|nr:hypothetical protein [Candidatus Micrarchaeota archaeon]
MLFAIVLAGMLSAQTVLGSLSNALSTFCSSLKNIVPIAAMMMVVGAGVIYAAGQLMGAETRARANVWATSMLVGAVIGIMIVVVAPPILSTLLGSAVSC